MVSSENSHRGFAIALQAALAQMGGRAEVRILEKLVFLGELFSYRDDGERLTEMTYVAAKFGPVPAVSSEEIIKKFLPEVSLVEGVAVSTVVEPNAPRAIKRSVATYGDYSFEELSQITHGFPAYFMAAPDGEIDVEHMKIPFRFGPISRTS